MGRRRNKGRQALACRFFVWRFNELSNPFLVPDQGRHIVVDKARSEVPIRRQRSVAEVARNHQFAELGRFAVTHRTTFGESPSATLQRDPQK
jgi:hypothetical protein